MPQIKIIADSTSDIPPHLAKTMDIAILPLYVHLGDRSLRDGIDVTKEEIFAYSDAHNTTPKTSAPTLEDALTLLRPLAQEGRDVLYLGISEQMSASCQIMRLAARDIEGIQVCVIDSKNLSCGVGMLALIAAQMAQESASLYEIEKALLYAVPRLRVSFVVETALYLYRGGRCSAVAAVAASALRLKPMIVVEGGTMHSPMKFRGRQSKALAAFFKHLTPLLKNANPRRAFVVHTLPKEQLPIVENIASQMRELGIFNEVLISEAGCVIASHCGPGTLGIMYEDKD